MNKRFVKDIIKEWSSSCYSIFNAWPYLCQTLGQLHAYLKLINTLVAIQIRLPLFHCGFQIATSTGCYVMQAAASVRSELRGFTVLIVRLD